MPRKTRPEKPERRGAHGRSSTSEIRTPRPKPKIDFTVDALDFKNTNLLRQFVTDQGRILPRKYTGPPITSGGSTAPSNGPARCF
jgi:small subunit ribosomal protein S18